MKIFNQKLSIGILIILCAFLWVGCSAPEAEPAPQAAESQDPSYPSPTESLSAASREVAEGYPEPEAVVAESENDAMIGSMVVEEIDASDSETDSEDDSMEEASTMADSASMGNGDADVIFVEARATGENIWTFNVTVEHEDTGWEDYADGWDVVLEDGTVLTVKDGDTFTRLLLHPHENEQPFTRSQSNIVIPAEITTVRVRAHDLVDGFGGNEIVVNLDQESGEGFTVTK